MSNRPLVSVIMNCYNGEKYLRQAIDSVLTQTWDNWEIIFWDNQSTDQSATIFKSYNDKRLKYFFAPTHTLLYEARNYAIKEAKGDYFAFLDVDDWWAPEKIEMQLPLFSDPEVGMACGNYWVNNTTRKIHKKATNQLLPQGWVLDTLLKNYSIGLVTLMVSRAAFESLEYPFDPRYHIIGDFDLSIRLATRWKLGSAQTPIATYRLHGNNETQKQRTRQITELEQWIAQMKTHPRIGRSPHLECVTHYKNYIAAMGNLLAGDRRGAFLRFRQLPFGYYKARLLIALLLPSVLIMSLKTG